MRKIKLKKCPHCSSDLVKVYDSQKLGSNVGGHHVGVKCITCGHYAPHIYYGSRYMYFAGQRGVMFDLDAAVDVAVLRWNARSKREYLAANRKVSELAKACSTAEMGA